VVPAFKKKATAVKLANTGDLKSWIIAAGLQFKTGGMGINIEAG
jgi:hypothetical protein